MYYQFLFYINITKNKSLQLDTEQNNLIGHEISKPIKSQNTKKSNRQVL